MKSNNTLMDVCSFLRWLDVLCCVHSLHTYEATATFYCFPMSCTALQRSSIRAPIHAHFSPVCTVLQCVDRMFGMRRRCADRVVQLCFQNGGVYIKAGQHLGQMDHLLPATYVRTLRASLLDRCPVSPPAEVAATITNDLGAPPEQLFHSFDPRPIASASLAQVCTSLELIH